MPREPLSMGRTLSVVPGRATAPIALAVLGVVWAFAADGPDAYDVQALAIDSAPLCLAALAAALVVERGGIDVSVGALLVLTATAVTTVGGHAVAVDLAFAAIVAAGAACAGVLTAFACDRCRLPAIAVTSVGLFVWSGLGVVVAGALEGSGRSRLAEDLTRSLLTRWLPIVVVVVAAALGVVVVAGRFGISRVSAYALAGGLAGVGGVVLAAGGPGEGPAQGWELAVLAVGSVVLGGAAGKGGVVASGIALTLVVSVLRLDGVQADTARLAQMAAGGLLVVYGTAFRRELAWAPVFATRFGAGRKGTLALGATLCLLVAVAEVVDRAVAGEGFLSERQLAATLLFASVIGLLALGQSLVVSAGGLDLAAAATAGAAGVAVAVVGGSLGIAVALGVGALLGAANRGLTTRLGSSPVLTSLALAVVVLAGATVVERQGQSAIPKLVGTVGTGELIWFVPYAVLAWLVGIVIVAGLQRAGTAPGWELAGVLAALAGLVVAGAIGAATPQLAAAYLAPSIAAVALARAAAGRASVGSLAVAVLAVAVADALLTIVDLSIGWRDVLWGLVALALLAGGARRQLTSSAAGTERTSLNPLRPAIR